MIGIFKEQSMLFNSPNEKRQFNKEGSSMGSKISMGALFVLAVGMAIATSGCNSYATPKRGADLKTIEAVSYTPSSTPETKTPSGAGSAEPQPTAQFPVDLAIVRMSASFGTGLFSVMTVRDIETEEDYDRILDQTDIEQIVTLNRLLLPKQFQGYQDLQRAADRLHADMLLIYTIDTAFYDRNSSTPLTVITLGFSPTVQIKVVTTISGILLDAKTDYVYGALEVTDQKEKSTSALSTKDDCDALRVQTERAALDKFLDEFETTWRAVRHEYNPKK
jgi:hypothetical protein